MCQARLATTRQGTRSLLLVRAQAQESSSISERVNPYPEDFYESLPLMTQRHNTMLERYLEQDKAIHRLSQEIKDVSKGLVGINQAQQDQLKRFQQQGELHRSAIDKAYIVEANMSIVASHMIDLRKELDHTVHNVSSQQQDMTATMTELTQELHQVRISANQHQSCPREDPPTSMSNKPTEDPTGPQSPIIEQDTYIHTV